MFRFWGRKSRHVTRRLDTKLDYTLDEVLREINAERVYALGMKPLDKIPMGKGEADLCPVSEAFDAAYTDGENYYLNFDGSSHPLPDILRWFILDFDSGEYPELVLPKEFLNEYEYRLWQDDPDRYNEGLIEGGWTPIKAKTS